MGRFVVEKLRSEAMIKSMDFFCDGRVAAGIPCRAGLRMDHWIVLGVGFIPALLLGWHTGRVRPPCALLSVRLGADHRSSYPCKGPCRHLQGL